MTRSKRDAGLGITKKRLAGEIDKLCHRHTNFDSHVRIKMVRNIVAARFRTYFALSRRDAPEF